MQPVAALILTYNEEANIEKCLASIASRCREIHVVDSGSTDRTVELCESFGAVVHLHPFTDSASQWDWAFHNVTIGADWVFILDADHVVTEELWEEIARILPLTRP